MQSLKKEILIFVEILRESSKNKLTKMEETSPNESEVVEARLAQKIANALEQIAKKY